MKTKKKYIWLIIPVIGIIIYFFVIKKKNGDTALSNATDGGASVVGLNTGILPTTSTATAPTRVPPPGYSGPVGGPFIWAGVGSPPNGVFTTIGNLL